jgi:hypothetical protein
MEAAAIARLAQMRGIPFYCFKGVSDGFHDKLPDFNRFIRPDGQFDLTGMVLFSILRPWHWPSLIRMGENSSKASHSLRDSCSISWTNEVTSTAQWLPKSQTLKAGPNRFNGSRLPTMRAVVYRGVNDMRVETVPVPKSGRRSC